MFNIFGKIHIGNGNRKLCGFVVFRSTVHPEHMQSGQRRDVNKSGACALANASDSCVHHEANGQTLISRKGVE